MTAEYGIFNDEGLLEGQFHDREVAEAKLSAEYAEDEYARVATVCPDHPEEEADHCQSCAELECKEEAEEAELEDEEDHGECPECGGPLMLLGALGNTKHFRCRNCGMTSS